VTEGPTDQLKPEVPSSEPAAARSVFGERLPLARRYAVLLARDGVSRGLIGPREAERLWERHLLNSAILADVVPRGCRVVDVGSGAGLPGIPLALRRADLRVDLVEPMLRRTDFLNEVVAGLDLRDRVRVIRGRADEATVRQQIGGADRVTARAVAPLDRLVKWCLPLVAPGGALLALKGARAVEEVAEHADALHRLGAGDVTVQRLGEEVLAEPTWVVIVGRPGRPTERRTRRSRP
jgi:16S rRNA (guanine527-N7)-methyltransferase